MTTTSDNDNLEKLEEVLGVHFKIKFIKTSTNPPFVFKRTPKTSLQHNERLEFLETQF